MRLALALPLLFPAIAYADETAAELEQKGAQLAKDSHYGEAIEAFKAAERLAPRASHVCLIALAYTRLERWPQAEIFLDKCHQRASDSDPLPAWVPLADQQLRERLEAANVAAVALVVAPDVPATLTVSSFSPDETFSPRTIHLAPGRHVVSVEAAGYTPAQQTIDVVDKTAQHVVIELHPITVVEPPHPRPPPPPPPVAHASSRSSVVPWAVMGGGAALALTGLGVHLFAVIPVRDRLQAAHDANDHAAYAADSSSFDTRRTATLVLYGAGALAIAAGAILHYTVFKEHDVVVAAAPTTGGAMVTFEVRR